MESQSETHPIDSVLVYRTTGTCILLVVVLLLYRLKVSSVRNSEHSYAVSALRSDTFRIHIQAQAMEIGTEDDGWTRASTAGTVEHDSCTVRLLGLGSYVGERCNSRADSLLIPLL